MDQTPLQIGDTVRVKYHTTETLHGDLVEAYLSNRVAVITGFFKDYAWRKLPNKASLRIVDKDDAWCSSALLDLLTLEVKGPGRFELGVTHPYSPTELRNQRWAAFVETVDQIDLSHEGFTNAATFLAWMYLNQEPSARRQLQGFIRKNGTINPNKVANLFSGMNLTIDSWAFDCPLDIPAEFSFNRNPSAARQAVNWTEVAAQFATAD